MRYLRRYRGQSEVIGIVLMTAVVVILSVVVGGAILSTVDTQAEPAANVNVSIDATNVTISHHGGTGLSTEEVTVHLRSGDTERHLLETFWELQGDGDDTFSPGEQVTRIHNASDVVRILVVHDPSNTILYDRAFDVPGSDLSPLIWERSTDWDAATTESTVVHDAFGTHQSDRIELGYPASSGGLLAYWPLDEDAGSTASDVSGNGNDGTIESATIGESGVLSTTSYSFDGTDDYVSDATDISALRNTASLSFWIKTTQTGDDMMWQAPGITGIEQNGGVDDIFWGWINASGHIGVQAGDDPGAISTTQINDGTWHHVVLTRDGNNGTVEVYVDGTREDTATSRSGEITTTFDSIGRIEDTAGSPEYFEGQIDELQVYDRVLSGTTVQNLSNTASDGYLVTANKTFAEPVDPTTLSLTDVTATIPSATNVSVYVESDPEGDGTFTRSDEIPLDSSASYEVTGLSTESDTYRLRIELETSSVTASPSFGGATLQAE